MRTLIATTLLLVSGAWAAADFVFQPPESVEPWVGTRVPLARASKRGALWGMAVPASNLRGTLHRLYLRAHVGDASGTYSIWLARHNEQGRRLAEVRVDETYPPLRADLDGRLFFVHNLDRSPLGLYDTVLIKHHPDAEAGETADAIEVLRGQLAPRQP